MNVSQVSELDIEYLLPSHTQPIVGRAKIQQQLQIYADAIKYIHDQTSRLMNKGNILLLILQFLSKQNICCSFCMLF